LAGNGPARQKAFPLVGIGEALIRLGRHAEARDGLLFALDCHRRVGALPDVVFVLSLLADIEAHAGRPDHALEHRRQALQAAHQAGEPALILEAARRVAELAPGEAS
jgi:hypothetical protein